MLNTDFFYCVYFICIKKTSRKYFLVIADGFRQSDFIKANLKAKCFVVTSNPRY